MSEKNKHVEKNTGCLLVLQNYLMLFYLLLNLYFLFSFFILWFLDSCCGTELEYFNHLSSEALSDSFRNSSFKIGNYQQKIRNFKST